MNEQDKKVNTRREKDGWDKRKVYEIMLLEGIPETKRPNEPTHAVLEGQLGKWDVDGQNNQSVRNHALIHYIADLANSNEADDIFDYEFVESLLQHGADLNCMDPTGQTIFHEVARSWNTDVAKFLVENGANINHQDQFGRSPLHVAAAVDYASMVEFIIQNGGDIEIKTKGEEQTAVHFAAKNDAINSLQMLLGYGANIDARDCRNRTPLQVAAEMNRFKAAKLLVTEGAPAGVYDNLGNCALSLLVEKIPEVALIALDQLHSVDFINRREFYFLNYLEGVKLKDGLRDTPARSPLEIAVQNERFDVVMHPVMRRLIGVKWNIYGKRGAILDLVLNLIYTILWSIEGVTMPSKGHELYLPVQNNIWRFIIDSLILLFTLVEIKRQVQKTMRSRRQLKKWREWRAEQLQQDKQYCHPRWPQEEEYLNSEIEAVQGLRLVSSFDAWVYFDWACLFLILATITTNILFFEYDSIIWKQINNHTTIAMLLILWLRMFKYARPFENAGPFVVIFSKVVGDILKWVMLNAIIIIPFACAFWIEFGFNSNNPAAGYTDVSSLIYNVFQMMIVGDYGYDKLAEADVTMARILTGGFILSVGIITLNLLIALVSNTFERHYENAVANAIMQRASTILMLQSRLRKKRRKEYYEFIKSNASPQIVQAKYGRVMATNPEDRVTLDRAYDDIRHIKCVLAERFGRRYGKGNKSDLEIVREDLGKIKRSVRWLTRDVKGVKWILRGNEGQPMSPSSKGSRRDLCKTYSGNSSYRRYEGDSDEETWRRLSKKNDNENNNDNNNDNNNNNNNNNNTTNNNNNNNNSTTNNTTKDNTKTNDTIHVNFQPYISEFQSHQHTQTPTHPSLKETRSKKSRRRNRSRRSKMPDPISSESSDSDDFRNAGVTGTPYECQIPRDYREDIDWPRQKRSPSNGHNKLKRTGKGNRVEDDYNQWPQYLSASAEPRSHYETYGASLAPIPMYPSEDNLRRNTFPVIYHTTPHAPYYPNESLASQQRSMPPTRLNPQPVQPTTSSALKQPPAVHANFGLFPQVERSDAYSDPGEPSRYRRSSRGKVGQQEFAVDEVARSDQSTQYSHPDLQNSTELEQPDVLISEKVPFQVKVGTIHVIESEEEMKKTQSI